MTVPLGGGVVRGGRVVLRPVVAALVGVHRQRQAGQDAGVGQVGGVRGVRRVRERERCNANGQRRGQRQGHGRGRANDGQMSGQRPAKNVGRTEKRRANILYIRGWFHETLIS